MRKQTPLTELQTSILSVMRDPTAPTLMSATEIAVKMKVAPGRLAGPLGGLRRRKLLGRAMANVVPFQMIFGIVVRRDGALDRAHFVPRKRHYALTERRDYVKAFKRIRHQCLKMYIDRFHKLTFNQREQALIGNWNV